MRGRLRRDAHFRLYLRLRGFLVKGTERLALFKAQKAAFYFAVPVHPTQNLQGLSSYPAPAWRSNMNAGKHRYGSEIQRTDGEAPYDVPLHRGAKRFYRDEGYLNTGR